MKEIENTYWYQINYFGSRNLDELLNLLDKNKIFYHCIGVSGNWDARPYYYIHHQKEEFINNLKSIMKN